MRPLLLVLMLSACAELQPLPDVREVKVAISVPCIKESDVPRASFITDSDLLKLPDGPFVYALAKDRLDRQAHIGNLEAALKGCVEEAKK